LVRTDRAYRSTNRAKVFWFFFSKKNCLLAGHFARNLRTLMFEFIH
jgi:hypothetical protein